MCARWHIYKFKPTGHWFAVGDYIHVFDTGARALEWMNGRTQRHHTEPTA